MAKKKGSIGWLIFWIIGFWPAAIIYALIRDWDVKKKEEQPVTFEIVQ